MISVSKLIRDGLETELLKMTIADSVGATTAPSSEPDSAKRRGSQRIKVRKFYLVQYKAHSRGKGVELVNRRDVFGDGHPRVFTPPGNLTRGFRDYPAKPRFQVSTRLGRMPNDIGQHEAYWLVSDRAKQALSNLSDTDFKFLALDVDVDVGKEPLVFWLCEVMPVLDAVDVSRSHVEVGRGDSGEPVYRIRSDMKLFFDESIVGSHHIFRLKTNFLTIVCDDAFKAAIKEAGLTGLRYQDVTAS